MNKNTYTKRIFEPEYAYRVAIRWIGEHRELKMMLDSIGEETLLSYTDDFERVYPLRTLYHKYKSNLLVLSHSGDGFMGQVFKNGRVDECFDMQSEREAVMRFFLEAGEELTVLDFFTGKEVKPDFDTVEAYMALALQIEKEFEEHSALIEDFKARHQALRRECEAFYCTSPEASYKKAINLLRECIETAEGAFRIKHRHSCRKIESFLSTAPAEESSLKLFGLYVYALKYAIDHKRFLKYGAKSLRSCFNNMVSDMRKFIAENEGIADRYIDYMNLTKNERENLLFLLSEEGLMSYGKQVGDDLFC